MDIEQIIWVEEYISSRKEFSINVKNPDGLKLYLKEGKAEIHGRELPLHTLQQFQKGERFCIYTWSESTICLEYKNDEDFFYLTDQTNYSTYINISQYINELRQEAQEFPFKIGPRILVCGGKQSGKTTIVKIFTNYACKLGWKPIMVDLDPDMNSILTSCCIGAVVYRGIGNLYVC
ncbi:pre-mRNA cleavage complex ii protein clp1, putative [Ichthyophthirius multifiliis]|uniref:Pre-mRNA cleavage complex ii protein clp1, putative n=1 Tax=Ichthyophthirius multifiliis TaxID=5932 RepID=G0QJ33_ICHMU|nr:pre-mRNA cleavage complex ii protein clp1, putative [Ichthyophthirius multifiliis]EGR34757.1 pre-mRNA cleavage complex ii protein clp1, putative [Ichthyophthirius multifiliis]|eukprot:XP_004040061.1 pre-mRNA cleavage complex ii protein clp1, putative [Ichthyophthirius multifiliis]